MAGLTSAGALDNTFGSSGKILLWSSIDDSILLDAAMLADGSFVILYWWNIPRVAKYTADGQLDPSFSANLILPSVTYGISITPGANGKLYVVLQRGLLYSIIRLNANGSRDETFGPNGALSLDLGRIPPGNRRITGTIELEGGKILVTGSNLTSNQWEVFGFAARFDSDMNLDRSFGRQGMAQLAIPGGYTIGVTRTVASPDGKYLLAGHYTFLGSYAMLIRLTNRARYDTSFGNAGISLTSVEDINVINGVALSSNGKIVVAGSTSDKTFPTVEQMWVASFNSNGLRESLLPTSFIAGRDSGGADVAVQPDGKIVAVGYTRYPTGSNSQFAVARFVP